MSNGESKIAISKAALCCGFAIALRALFLGILCLLIASLTLAMTQDYHFALFFVIASECNERGNQQARNPRIMKDSMPFDCFASLAMTDSSILLCPKSLQVAIETIPPSPPDNAASRFAMAMGQRA